MCKIKTLLLLVAIFLCSTTSYSIFHYTTNSHKNSKKDSILVLKSEFTETIKIESDKVVDSTTTAVTNYHIINFDTSEIILCFKSKEQKWERQTFEYYSTIKSSEIIEFDTTSDISIGIYLTINPLEQIIYGFKNGTILTFSELEIMDNKEFDRLEIYNWTDSFNPIKKSKEIIINERIKGFEYSEYWRKESFKKTIPYLQQKMGEAKPKCEMIRRSSYNPIYIEYIGSQGFRVQVYAEYDCNQDYINQAYFWVDAYYLGYGKWSLELVEQKLTH